MIIKEREGKFLVRLTNEKAGNIQYTITVGHRKKKKSDSPTGLEVMTLRTPVGLIATELVGGPIY